MIQKRYFFLKIKIQCQVMLVLYFRKEVFFYEKDKKIYYNGIVCFRDLCGSFGSMLESAWETIVCRFTGNANGAKREQLDRKQLRSQQCEKVKKYLGSFVSCN